MGEVVLHRHHLRRHRARYQMAYGVCVFHRKLEAQPRRGALPDGLQPRCGAAASSDTRPDGRADALGRAATPHVAQRDQGIRNRREYDVEQRRDHRQLLRQLRWAGRDRRSHTAKSRGRWPTGRLNPDRITEATFTQNLHCPDMPDVDLFMRTSGEQRSSNFLIWQAAYAEYVFQDKLWPDYDRRDLWAACEEYVNRNRRFGRADGTSGAACRRARRSAVDPEEEDGAVTVHHDHTFASLRVVTIAEGLEMVSLTQILAWDLPLDSKIRERVVQHAHDTLLGTVSLVEKSAGGEAGLEENRRRDAALQLSRRGPDRRGAADADPDGPFRRRRRAPGVSA